MPPLKQWIFFNGNSSKFFNAYVSEVGLYKILKNNFHTKLKNKKFQPLQTGIVIYKRNSARC
ncbi:hypothetical protein ASG21_18180 [Chryseobacterium sp. Leaf394]|nr:hypothetical protein ASG21_18180 [Chryseobacterium sp. Leaf394]